MHTLTSSLLLTMLLLAPLSVMAKLPADLKTVGQGDAFYLSVIKVYNASLAVGNNATRTNVLEADVSRCLTLDYAVDLSADKFALAADTILKRQHDTATLQSINPQLAQLHNAYQDVKVGDIYQMCYDAKQQTTRLLLNDKPLTSVKSAEFANVYFGIWLGEKQPITQALRESLLKGL
ncbi:chalcone isomerase family protein [Thiothrix lacustris]|uniref:chalcone isomerase family protein n=1 Tax=Thiothrix lacustris TaxID=525917 RepID=UPI0027E56A5B|nr:chalcone isomerase family protein [Thiothrix lacustris]WMP17582.1 chalcone isomerase family protein [Thiothrix lacustris]